MLSTWTRFIAPLTIITLCLAGCAGNGETIEHNTAGTTGNSKVSMSVLDKIIELKPDDAEAYFNRAVAKDELADYKGAMADYDKAIEIDPNCADAYSNRSAIKYTRGDYKGAISDYGKAIELNPDYAKAYSERGVAKRILGIPKEPYPITIKQLN
ncbi:MAG: tetratricopeptide repeat protein [Planctomycetes bacterium]|nr:tetratricopeptide repeat protein [Planctomycetota bacterium]